MGGTDRTLYVSHWFDGFAHSHKFDIVVPAGPGQETTVQYSSRRQSEEWVAAIRNRGWRTTTTFAQKADPCIGIFGKVMSFFEPSKLNFAVTVLPNVPGLASQNTKESGHRTATENLWIGTDYAGLGEVDPDTLEPIGSATQKKLHPDLQGVLSCAHAHRDPETGDLFNYNLELKKVSTYRVFRTSAATGATDILATIMAPCAYIHSFFLTQNFVVLCIPSTHFGWNGLRIPWEHNLADAIKPFDEATLSQWYVVDRRHSRGVVARFATPAGFFFHSVNAFEEVIKDASGQSITCLNLDHILYGNSDIIQSYYYDVILDRHGATKSYWLENGRHKSANPRFVRYTYRMSPEPLEPSKDFERAEETISIPAPHIGELPTINPLYTARSYRFVYSVPSRGLSTVTDSLAKSDVITRETWIWCGGRGHSPGEPIFVADPESESEDGGVLLSMVLDGEAKTSYLVCLDARTMVEMGRAEADFAIGMGFHGTHRPEVRL